MDWQFLFGLGVAIVSAILQYAVKDMPQWIAWSLISVGASFIVWGLLPNHERVPLPVAFLFILGVAITAGAAICAVEFLRSDSAISVQAKSTEYGTVSPPQEKLLGLLFEYERRFATTKLIVSRESGRLYFDGDLNRGKNVNLVRDLFDSDGEVERAKFRDLIEDMPSSFLRLIPENRWDAPFVIKLTEEGRSYLKNNKINITLPKRPELDIATVFNRSDRHDVQFWYVSLTNNGGIEARDFKLQLVGMDRKPAELSWKGLYPYNVRPESLRGALNWDGTNNVLTPGESIIFGLFETRLATDGFRVVGMDSNDVSRRNDTSVVFWPGEEWILNYKATAFNANPIAFRVHIIFIDGKLRVENID